MLKFTILVLVTMCMYGCATSASRISQKQTIKLNDGQGIIAFRLILAGKSPGITFEEKNTKFKFDISYDRLDKIPNPYVVPAGEYCLKSFVYVNGNGIVDFKTKMSFEDSKYCFKVIAGELAIAPELYEQFGGVKWVNNDWRIANALEKDFPLLKPYVVRLRQKLKTQSEFELQIR